MSKHRFYQVDVFTRTPLAGNALAVFPDAKGLHPETMQALAREMNLSETTFVTRSKTATRRVRFFTPAAEIPLAGHPTIGTWWLLAELELIKVPRRGVHRVTQETGRGVLPVDITTERGQVRRVEMTQPLPEFGPNAPDASALAAAIGGDARTLANGPAAQLVTTALPQLMVPVRSLAALKALPSGGTGPELTRVLRTVSPACDCAMMFTLDTRAKDVTVRCRMFSPALGVPEDPATGSAAGALGCYLVWHNLVRPHGGVANIVIEQGAEISRPSRMHVTITAGNGGEITDVRVGGEAVTIISGDVRL
ncbi:MAG TPA: PhzF family phenazine biosynthesis protein [Gemmatimonadales bacterium]|jgi:trans-2,3-dihydro-3-hydroxyanthranilate isomerase